MVIDLLDGRVVICAQKIGVSGSFPSPHLAIQMSNASVDLPRSVLDVPSIQELKVYDVYLVKDGSLWYLFATEELFTSIFMKRVEESLEITRPPA
jgi:hypothetical protein